MSTEMGLPLPDDYSVNEILTWTTLRFAEETESWESVETLLCGGASFHDLVSTKSKLKDPKRALSVVSELCRRGCLRLLKFALSQDPTLVNKVLDEKRTLLHVAAQSGCSVSVRCLMDANANVNVSDWRGVTPLHEAAGQSDYYVLLLLLSVGANLEARDVDGRSALHYAASGGSAPCVQILLTKGLSVNMTSGNGCTPLHEAAASSNPHCVQLLLTAGADVQAKTDAGWTALHWAASKGTDRALTILLDAGIPVDCKTEENETPLHFAAERGATEMLSLLVDAGADVEVEDSFGRTPAQRASDRILQKMKAEAAAASAAGDGEEELLADKNDSKIMSVQGNTMNHLMEKPRARSISRHKSTSSLHLTPAQSLHSLTFSDEVEGSDYSYESESEISARKYTDSGSDFDDDYSVDSASGQIPIYDGPQPLTAVNLQPPHQLRGHGNRGNYRARGRGHFRGGKSETRDGRQTRDKLKQSDWQAENRGRGHSTGYVADRGNHRHRHRTRQHQEKAEDRTPRKEYHMQKPAGKKEYVPKDEDTRRKHPFSKDRQKQANDPKGVAQNIGHVSGRNLPLKNQFGFIDNVHREESRTFLDELRIMQEKLATVNTRSVKPQKSNQRQNRQPNIGNN